MPPTAADLGGAIRRACKDAGVTQKQVAEATGRDQTTISAWMKGENWPALGALPTIDALCGQPRGYILRLAGFVEPDATVEGAVAADRVLDDDGRGALLLFYRTLVRSSAASARA